jgi:3-oxoacyl-[acyl-carrier-protein] synthase-3
LSLALKALKSIFNKANLEDDNIDILVYLSMLSEYIAQAISILIHKNKSQKKCYMF